MAKGKIEFKDVIDDNIFGFGERYAKSIETAIGANEKYVKSFDAIKQAALGYAEVEKQFKASNNRGEFLAVKQKEKELTEQTIVATKEQDRTERALITTIERKTIATESTNKALIRERLELERLNKSEKEEAILKSTTSTFIQKITVLRAQAGREIQNLVAKQAVGNKLTKEETESLKQLSAQFFKYDTAIKQAKITTNQFYENVGNYPKQLGVAINTLRSMVSQLGLLSGAYLGLQIVKNAFNDIREFDRQLIAVGKTTNITGNDLQDFGRAVVTLGDQLDGISVDGLLKASEVAGQLGIKGTQNLLKFSETIEKLKLSSDIQSDESVIDFAKFIEVSKDSVENADRLGSVITELGNNFATTEKQVLSNASEIQKGLSSYEASAQSVLGLGAATSALGNEADTSRTAIQKTFGVINDAVATGKNLQGILKLTGLTQKELSDQFKTDATGVFQRFVKGLSDSVNAGENLKVTLDALDITETRQTTVLGSLAANYELLEDTLARSGAEYENNTALTREAAAAAESISSIIGDISDRWSAYIHRLNDASNGTSKITSLLKFLRDNLEEILKVLGYITGLWLVYRTAIITTSVVTRTYTAVVGALRIAKIALSGGIAQATTAMRAFNIAAKGNPIGLIVTLLAAAAVAFYEFSDGVKKTSEGLRRLKKDFNDVKAAIVENDIALIESQLASIDNQVENQKEATQKKLDLLNDEIKQRVTGVSNLYDTEEEIQKKSLEKQIEEQSKADTRLNDSRKSNEEYLRKLREGGFDTPVPGGPLRRPTEEDNVPGGVPAGVTAANAEFEAAKDVNKKLLELRAQLLKRLNQLNNDAQKEDAEIRNKLLRDAIELEKFGVEEIIKEQKKIADSDLYSFESRSEAFAKIKEQELKLNELNTRQKVIDIKKGTDQYNLIVEQAKAKEKEIIERFNDEILDLEIEQIKTEVKIKTLEKEKQLDEELELENRNYLSTLDQYDSLEKAIEAHEKRVADIKKKYAIEALENQITLIEKLLEAEELSATQRAEYEKKLADFKKAISDIVTDEIIDDAKRRADAEKEASDRITDLTKDAAVVVTDLANAIFDNKIGKLDEEIRKNDEKYSRLLENENLSEAQRTAIEKQQEADRERLEKKKAQEQRKAATFNKLLSVAQIGINTAEGITKNIAQLGLVLAQPLNALTIAIGLGQVAAVVATKIPQYFKGTDNHPGGPALLAEREPEVVTEPGKKPYIVDKPSILDLPAGTKVTPSVEEYKAMMRASALASLEADRQRLNSFQTAASFDLYNDQMIEELRLTRKAIEKNRSSVVVRQTRPVDFQHELFKLRNTNWNA